MKGEVVASVGDTTLWRWFAAWDTPIHASWLNQIEIYFSVVQRKVLAPNDFQSLDGVEDRLLRFHSYYAEAARPFKWGFARHDLDTLLSKLQNPNNTLVLKAAW